MNLAALLIPPSLDAKQSLRLRRFGLAALTYALATALVAIAWMFGVLPASAALEVAAAFLAINLGLYAVIRSGFNLRFEDPSLTRFQILAAITVLMYVVYHTDDGRNIVLFACFIVFLFGVFRLDSREFAVVTLYTLAAYALVINLLMHFRPQAIHEVSHEWMSWLGFAVFLPYFTIVGGQINTLRRRLRESEMRASEVRESEMRFRSLTEMSSDFYWESDVEHRLTMRGSASQASRISMFAQGAQVGQRRWEIPYLSPDDAGWQAHRAVLDARRPFRDFEFSRLGTDGTEQHISISGDPVFDGAGAFKGYRGVGKNISERKAAEAKIARLTQFYAALSQCSQAIVRCASEEELLQQVCRAAVVFGGMKMAWIGFIDPGTRMVRFAARYGDRADEYLQGVEISVDADSPLGRGPTGIAIRENRPVWWQDLRQQPLTAPWHERRARFGWEASASLPLRRGGVVVGVLTLYAGEAGAFDEAVSDLLIEMAEDISFALDNFERESGRQRAEEALHESEARFRSLTEMSSDFYWESDAEHRLTRRGSVGKLSKGSLLQRRVQIGERRWEVPSLSPDEAGWQAYRAVLDAHRPFRDFEFSRLGTDGAEYLFSISGDPLFDASGAFKGYRGVGTDITKRKRAEARLRKLSHAVEQSPAATVITDIHGRVEYVNPKCLEITGFTREELIGNTTALIKSGLTPADVYEDLWRTILTGGEWRGELQNRRKNGELYWEYEIISPLKNERGEIVNFIAVKEDITERKQAQDALRDSENLLRLIVENVPARIFWKDRDLRYLGCNTLFAKDAGHSRPDELTGKTDFELAWKDQAELYRDDDKEVLESDVPKLDIEEPQTTPEGNTIWLRTSKVPLRDKDGRIIGLLGLYQDITERKQTEEEIRSFAKFPAENPYPVLRISRNGTILHANQSSAPILTAWGREVGQAVPDDWQKWIAATLESGMAKEVEIAFNRRIVSCTLVPVLAEEYVNVYGRDITERKQAEAALQQEHASLLQSQRELLTAHESLAEADRLESVGRLAAGVAHEVKNPLTIIRLGTDYLAKQFSQESNRAVFDKVRGAIDRADNVIGGLLEFSRQKPFAPRTTNINDVIDHAINLIKHEIDRRNIAIIRNCDDPMPPIDADPDRLVQVFINLLTNAAHAIGQGGSIEIVTRSICLNERDLEHAETGMFRPGEPVVSVDIRDTGPGIPAENEKKLFDPFFTTKPTGEGFGLGLAVSRSIVIMHRGSIRISNRPEGGASALLMFRVAREHSTNEKANTGSR